MDKLTAMRTFVAVAQSGSFSAAARKLGLPKTRVSQRVQELEAALAVRLLHRTTRVVSLTEEGRFYLEKCLPILEDIDATEQAMTRAGEEPVGRLKISCMSLVARALILPRLGAFLSAYPRVTVGLSVSDRIANLQESGLDLAIRGGALENSSLISRPLGQVPFGLYAAPGLLGPTMPADIEDLARLPLVKTLHMRAGATRHWDLRAGDRALLEDSPARVEVDDDAAALEAALAGVGVVLTARFAAEPLVRAGLLVPVLPDWQAAARPIYAIYPTRRHPSARLRAFLDWVEPLIRQA